VDLREILENFPNQQLDSVSGQGNKNDFGKLSLTAVAPITNSFVLSRTASTLLAGGMREYLRALSCRARTDRRAHRFVASIISKDQVDRRKRVGDDGHHPAVEL